MTKHKLKQMAVKQSLTERLKRRTAQAIAKHGSISAEQCDKWRREAAKKEEKRKAKLKGRFRSR